MSWWNPFDFFRIGPPGPPQPPIPTPPPVPEKLWPPGYIEVPGCVNCGCGQTGDCLVCNMPQRMYLFPWLIQRQGQIEQPRHECWDLNGVELNQQTADTWESALLSNGSQFSLRRLTISGGCESQVRRWCAVELTWICQGIPLAITGPNCPMGSLPDPGHVGAHCVSCTGQVQWRGSHAPIEATDVWRCCPNFLGPDIAHFAYVLSSVPVRSGVDCCCRLPNLFTPLTASMLVQGTCAYSATFLIYHLWSLSPGTVSVWQARQNLGHPQRWDQIQLVCSPADGGYLISCEAMRDFFEPLFTPFTNQLATLRSCSPLLMDVEVDVLCRDFTTGRVRVTISE